MCMQFPVQFRDSPVHQNLALVHGTDRSAISFQPRPLYLKQIPLINMCTVFLSLYLEYFSQRCSHKAQSGLNLKCLFPTGIQK
jgi:hypothetical protein